jgi:hypothetical protein
MIIPLITAEIAIFMNTLSQYQGRITLISI